MFGAAAGAGRVLGLGADEMNTAIGIAGTFAGGVREVFGSHAKAMHPAKAASNGVQSARLAAKGFSGADDILGGRRGFWQVLSPNGHSEEALLAEVGSRWELANNGLKPYANGVVSHPIQDAVITLRNEHGIAPEDVASINAEVNPLVLELMNRARTEAPDWKASSLSSTVRQRRSSTAQGTTGSSPTPASRTRSSARCARV